VQELLAALTLVKEAIDGVNALVTLHETRQAEAWAGDSAQAYAEIKAAKNPAERRKVAQEIRSLWATLG
jgi:hypothetical protein